LRPSSAAPGCQYNHDANKCPVKRTRDRHFFYLRTIFMAAGR